MANWWDEAYSAITQWSVSADQLNKDRGAYKDAFVANAAEKGLNYELTSRLMNESTTQEKDLMQSAADLDRRNTLDLMTGEHQFKMAGMQESNRLSKDYLAAQGYQERETLAEQGNQTRRTQEVVNKGAVDVEGVRAQASNYAQDSESQRSRYAQDAESNRVGLRGDEDRKTIRTQGDEARRSTAFEREHAAGLATRMSRR